jgi:arginine decarboxylase
VFTVKETCEAREVPEPCLVSESGRGLTAHHSVLVVPVLGAQAFDAPRNAPAPKKPHALVKRLRRVEKDVRAGAKAGELLEAYHDAREAKEEAQSLLLLGYLELEQAAAIEGLYWSACAEILERLRAAALEDRPPEQIELEAQLADLYLGNFSVFQSLLDHWAIGQAFPIVPLARLDERPTRRGVLVDLTCDSDGKVASYVTALEDSAHLPLHPLRADEPYDLGVFLVGAYQDILGDEHNLFGRVPEVHVYADDEEPGNFWIEKIIPGTKVQDMLAQVQYFPNDLERRMSEFVRRKIDRDQVKPSEGMRFLEEYLERFDDATYAR